METRYCPNCGKPLAFLPSCNRYFCNYCRLPFDAEGPASPAGAPAGAPAGPVRGTAGDPPTPPSDQEIPDELARMLPAEPPRETTLYAPTTDLKPMVRRSSLLKGTVEAMADDEARRAMQTGDYITLSKSGRSAIVAARKSFGEAQIMPRALDMPGLPWRFQIASGAASVEVGLFKAQLVRPPTRMPQPRSYPENEFYIASLALKGPAPVLSRFVSALVELLEEAPWASRYWALMSQSLGVPSSKLMLDWKQYLDYATARIAAGEVAASQGSLREAQRTGIISPEAQQAVERARVELSRGEWDLARAAARDVRGRLDASRAERRQLEDEQQNLKTAIEAIRRLEPASRDAAKLEEQLQALSTSSPLPPEQARNRLGPLLEKAGCQLIDLHAQRANAVLTGIQGEDDGLIAEVRTNLEGELAEGRRLIEGGDVGRGDEVLGRAIASASERIDGYLNESAASSAQQLQEIYESSKDNSALSPEFRADVELGLRQVEAHIESGRNKDAAQQARALKQEIEDRLENSAPEIRITINGPRLTAGSWNKVIMNIMNTGSSDAANVVIALDGPVELRAQDELPLLRAGETYKDEIAMRSEEVGSLPVTLQVDCERPHDSRPFHFQAELWLEFQKPLDLSGAKTVTIDRSVHIVDSVLNRSSVGDEGELGGAPPIPEDAETVEDGTVVIQDSVINRPGRMETGKAIDAAETKCPNCGRMISTGWKRCPYCS